MISENEFKDWLQHPVTRAVRELLDAKREFMRQQWEHGAFTDHDPALMAAINLGNIGTCKGYAFLQDLEYEDFMTESDDGKSIGPAPQGSGSAG